MTKGVKRAGVVLGLVWESVRFAVSSLRTDKFRTTLSLFGVTVGIFSIVLVLSIVDGLKNNIRRGMDSLGGNTITVQREPWDLSDEQGWDIRKYMKRAPIDVGEYDFLAENLEGAEGVAFFTSFPTYDGIDVVCVKGDFDRIFSFGTAQGRWFTPSETAGRQSICYVGAQVAKNLPGGGSPVGTKIKIRDFYGQVIGVAAPRGESLAEIFDIDNSIFVPYGFGETIYGGGSGGAIALVPRDGVGQGELADRVRVLMRNCRRLTPEQEDDFSINRISYLTSAVDELFASVNLVGWIIGGFALLIGGVGIANIMFVSVKERVPQIGIQKALGGPDYMILIQFLSESAVLSLAGGGIGILIVLIISLFLGENSAIPFDLSVWNVVRGLVIALATGGTAGFIPAYSASKMDPVKAINDL